MGVGVGWLLGAIFCLDRMKGTRPGKQRCCKTMYEQFYPNKREKEVLEIGDVAL